MMQTTCKHCGATYFVGVVGTETIGGHTCNPFLRDLSPLSRNTQQIERNTAALAVASAETKALAALTFNYFKTNA